MTPEQKTEFLARKLGKMIDALVAAGVTDEVSALQAKLMLTPQGGTLERAAILGRSDY